MFGGSQALTAQQKKQVKEYRDYIGDVPVPEKDIV